MLKIDDNLLQQIGLGSLPPEEKRGLLSHIYETLEMRVGMRLADQMSNEQLDEFERYFEAKDDAGAFKWLELNFPNYKDIVNEEFEKLKGEVAQTAPQILAAAQQNAAQAQQQLQQPQAPQSYTPQSTGQYQYQQPQQFQQQISQPAAYQQPATQPDYNQSFQTPPHYQQPANAPIQQQPVYPVQQPAYQQPVPPPQAPQYQQPQPVYQQPASQPWPGQPQQPQQQSPFPPQAAQDETQSDQQLAA